MCMYTEINELMKGTACKDWTSYRAFTFRKAFCWPLVVKWDLKTLKLWTKGRQIFHSRICCVSDSGHLLHWPLRASGFSECGLPGVSVHPLTLSPPGASVCQAPESSLSQGLGAFQFPHGPTSMISDEMPLQEGSTKAAVLISFFDCNIIKDHYFFLIKTEIHVYFSVS